MKLQISNRSSMAFDIAAVNTLLNWGCCWIGALLGYSMSQYWSSSANDLCSSERSVPFHLRIDMSVPEGDFSPSQVLRYFCICVLTVISRENCQRNGSGNVEEMVPSRAWIWPPPRGQPLNKTKCMSSLLHELSPKGFEVRWEINCMWIQISTEYHVDDFSSWTKDDDDSWQWDWWLESTYHNQAKDIEVR